MIALLLATLLSGSWRAVPAEGVELKLSRGAGRTDAEALRADFDFRGRGGYAIIRLDQQIELPENFELSFWMRAEAPRNTLEVKLVQGDNVWWHTRPELDYPREWRRISVRKRNFVFAWGPAGPSPLPKRIDALEIVVTAGTGGKGTVWIDDVEITPLEVSEGPPLHTKSPFTLDLGRRQEFGGLIIDWAEPPSRYEIATDRDGVIRRVTSTNGGRDFVYLPDADARAISIAFDKGALREVRTLRPLRTDNDFFTAIARELPRGQFPRYLYGEQLYWTILGGTNGEEAEALISEDGAIEAGAARFSIEPFLWIDGKLVSWNEVAIEQREGPQVVWPKHLTIMPRYENGTLRVRYVTAPNARLFLAIRPLQVNPPWQFLKRTGGTVKITKIAKEGDRITVTADRTGTLIATPTAFGATTFDNGEIVEHLRTGKLPSAQTITDDAGFASAALQFDAHDVTIQIPLDPPRAPEPPSPNNFTITIPAAPHIEQTIRAQLHYILINRDGPSIHPGSRSYERSWIRDGSLTSEALLRLGRADVVREFIVWYAKHVSENGYVPCCVSAAGADPVPEHDSHGQFIYLVAEYYRHTRDRALAEAQWPVIQRVVRYIESTREPSGLMPASISHEGYSAKPMHSYWDDLFVLKGLKDASFLARELGKPEAARYDALRDDFRRTLVASIKDTMQRHNIDYIPGSAELGDFDATSTTIAVTPVDEADALPRQALLRTFEKHWDHALEPRTYTPYEWRIVGTLVRLGQPERARALMDYFFADQRPPAWRHWAEVVHRNPREPQFIGDMPHTWVGSDFIRSALDLFVYEKDDALVLGAGIDQAWLDQGVTVDGISTRFGIVGYTIRRENGKVVRKLLRDVGTRIVWNVSGLP